MTMTNNTSCSAMYDDGLETTGVAGRVESARVDMRIEPAFDFLGDDYWHLFANADATAFQHPIWLDAFHRRLVRARDADALTVVGRKAADGALAFVLPLIRRRKSGTVLVEATDLGVSDYCAPIVDRNWRPDTAVHAAIQAVLPPFDLLRIRPVRAETLPLWNLFFQAKETQLDFSAHDAQLGQSYPVWRRNALDAGFAKYLDRRKKRFFKSGQGELRLLSQPNAIGDAITAIQTMRAGRFEGDLIAQDFVRDFYADVAVAGAKAGMARTYMLSLDGDAVGYVFGLTWSKRFYYLLIGCDYEKYGRHSPGLILYDTMIEDWIGDGGEIFDFTIGDEPFKRDFATAPTAMHGLMQTPSWRGKLASAAFDAREQLRRLKNKHSQK